MSESKKYQGTEQERNAIVKQAMQEMLSNTSPGQPGNNPIGKLKMNPIEAGAHGLTGNKKEIERTARIIQGENKKTK